MQMILTTSEIRAILQGCRQTLRLVQSTEEYRRIENSEYFSTSNDVVLNDAVNALFEVVGAIEEYEVITQQEEGWMEQQIKEAIGLGSPQLEPEPEPKPEPQPQITIYDFAKVLAENEPPKNK
ncbi:hypothetical protein IQ243_28675 [Nostocales cyanobacterium LEGE 11386]|nr:hypothetical protein [Nostocales cyanobacterium LEGE 11386]